MDRAAESPAPFVNPLEQMLSYQLRRASVAVMSRVSGELAPLGVKPSQASLIMMVAANPGCTQSAISRALRTKPANLVPLINQLVALGAVARKPGRGRMVALSLSAKGEDLLVSVRAALARVEQICARNFSIDEQNAALGTLSQLCHNACAVHDA